MDNSLKYRLCLVPLISLVACGDPVFEDPMDAGRVLDTSFPDAASSDAAPSPDARPVSEDSGPNDSGREDVGLGVDSGPREDSGPASECGNSECEPGESFVSCPADCEEPAEGAYPVGGWTVIANFDEGTLGDEAQGPGMLTDAFSNTVVTTEQSMAGGQAARMAVDEGATGFGQWGGLLNFGSPLGEGEDVWYRVYAYFPSTFEFQTDSGQMKFMRIHTESGYHDMLVRDGGGALTIYSEVNGPTFYRNNNPDYRMRGERITLGEWHAYEMHVHYSATPSQSNYQIWQDGVLVFEEGGNTATLASASSMADFVYIFSYFNGGSPRTQHAYVDEIVVTSGMPQDVDAHGNPYIGLGIIAPR